MAGMADRAGQQLGNYRLIRLIGKGGFAEVYLGEHVFLNTPVAIKVLHTQLSREDMEKFLKEARTIARLVHPHIVRVTDFGVESETPFLVMDYAPNGTLHQRHPPGSVLQPATVASYISQVAEALQYAHNERLVHRDIKPENMLIGRNNDILLSDFGIALVTQSSLYQNTQDVVGTIIYMSPEQINGKPRPASDQYALAIVAYEWLCGDTPFHGSFTELCTQHIYAAPPSLRAKNPTISPELDQVLQTALAKDPHLRFGSVMAFANAFGQAAQAGKIPNISVPPPPPSQPPPPLILPASLADTHYMAPSSPSMPAAAADTQYVAPPSARRTENTSPPVPGAGSVAYNGNMSNSKLIPNVPLSQKVNPWGFGRKQIVAAITGIIIFGLLTCIVNLLITNTPQLTSINATVYSYTAGNLTYHMSVGDILLDLIFMCPLFLAVTCGPWVGLCVGLVGGYAANYLVPPSGNTTFALVLAVSYAIAGFIAGLSYPISQRSAGLSMKIVIASILSIVGILIETAIMGYGEITIFPFFPNSYGWFLFLSNAVVQVIFALIVLNGLLWIWNRMVLKK
ncbi:MAG: protein kinase [Ktedonobacteraceae bacterium]